MSADLTADIHILFMHSVQFCPVLGICANRISLLFRARRPTQTSVSDRYSYTSQQAARWKSHLKICPSPNTTPCLIQQAACIHLLRKSTPRVRRFLHDSSNVRYYNIFLPLCRYAILFSQSRPYVGLKVLAKESYSLPEKGIQKCQIWGACRATT